MLRKCFIPLLQVRASFIGPTLLLYLMAPSQKGFTMNLLNVCHWQTIRSTTAKKFRFSTKQQPHILIYWVENILLLTD